MKNRINLLGDDFKPQVVLLNLNFVMTMTLVSVLAIITLWFWASQQHRSESARVDEIKQVLEQKQFMLDALTKAKAARGQNIGLLAKIEQNQQLVSAKRSILHELQQRESQRSNGFASLLHDLAKFHHQQLWLTNIEVNQRQLSMHGVVNESQALPQWLESLGQASSFQGREFAGVSLQQNSDGRLEFSLQSALDEPRSDAQ